MNLSVGDALAKLEKSYETKTPPGHRNSLTWEQHVQAAMVRCPHCSEKYLPGTDHDEDCEGVTCMWCGKNFPPDQVDAHEAGCA